MYEIYDLGGAAWHVGLSELPGLLTLHLGPPLTG